MRPSVVLIVMMTNALPQMKFLDSYSKLLSALQIQNSYVIAMLICVDKMEFSTWMSVNVAALSPTLTQTTIMVSTIKSKSYHLSTDNHFSSLQMDGSTSSLR